MILVVILSVTLAPTEAFHYVYAEGEEAETSNSKDKRVTPEETSTQSETKSQKEEGEKKETVPETKTEADTSKTDKTESTGTESKVDEGQAKLEDDESEIDEGKPEQEDNKSEIDEAQSGTENKKTESEDNNGAPEEGNSQKPSAEYHVTVTVKNEAGDALKDATVRLGKNVAQTDGEGQIIFEEVLNGIYSLKVEGSKEYELYFLEDAIAVDGSNISKTVILKMKMFDIDVEYSEGVKRVDFLASVKYGSNQTITYELEEGYELSKIYQNGKEISDTDGKIILTDITENQTLKMDAVKKTYVVNATISANGHMEYDGDEAGGMIQVEHGDDFIFTVMAEKRYHIKLVTCGEEILFEEDPQNPNIAKNAEYTIKDIKEEKNISAIFSPDVSKMSVKILDETKLEEKNQSFVVKHGEIALRRQNEIDKDPEKTEGENEFQLTYDDSLALDIYEAEKGYQYFVKVFDEDGKEIKDAKIEEKEDQEKNYKTYIFSEVDANEEIRITLCPITYTVEGITPFGNSVKISYDIENTNKTWIKDENKSYIKLDDPVQEEGYEFVKWVYAKDGQVDKACAQVSEIPVDSLRDDTLYAVYKVKESAISATASGSLAESTVENQQSATWFNEKEVRVSLKSTAKDVTYSYKMNGSDTIQSLDDKDEIIVSQAGYENRETVLAVNATYEKTMGQIRFVYDMDETQLYSFVVKQDHVNPTVKITQESSTSDKAGRSWEQSGNRVTIDRNSNQADCYKVSANDDGSGLASIAYQYVKFGEVSSLDEKEVLDYLNVQKWTVMDNNTSKSFAEAGEWVFIVRVTDKVGNTYYADSSGLLFDRTLPEITVDYTLSEVDGAENGLTPETDGSYYTSQAVVASITVKDEGLIYSTELENPGFYPNLTVVDKDGCDINISEKDIIDKKLEKVDGNYVWSGKYIFSTKQYADTGIHYLKVSAADRCGNSISIPSAEITVGKSKNGIVIDNQNPEIQVTYHYTNGLKAVDSEMESSENDQRKNVYSDSTIKASISICDALLVADKKTAYEDYKVFLNDTEKPMNGTLRFDEEKECYVWSGEMVLSKEELGENQKNTLRVTAKDAVGNEAKIYESKDLYIDDMKPVISVSYEYMRRQDGNDVTYQDHCAEEKAGEGAADGESVESKQNSFTYSSGVITATITIKDAGLCITRQDFVPKWQICVDGTENISLSDAIRLDERAGFNEAKTEWSGTYTFSVEDFAQKGLFDATVSACDEAGNEVTYQTGAMAIDTLDPAITKTVLEAEKADGIKKLLNKLTFGNFFSDRVKLIVSYEDKYRPKLEDNSYDEAGVTDGSGVSVLTLLLNGKEYQSISEYSEKELPSQETNISHEEKEGTQTFVLPYREADEWIEQGGKATLTAKDYVGNICDELEISAKSDDLVSSNVLYDRQAPRITSDFSNAKIGEKSLISYVDKAGSYWIDNSVTDKTFSITVEDADSGINVVSIQNHRSQEKEKDLKVVLSREEEAALKASNPSLQIKNAWGIPLYENLEAPIYKSTFCITYDTLLEKQNRIVANATDHSGMEAETLSFVICKDTTIPFVSITQKEETWIDKTNHQILDRIQENQETGDAYIVTTTDGEGSGIKTVEYQYVPYKAVSSYDASTDDILEYLESDQCTWETFSNTDQNEKAWSQKGEWVLIVKATDYSNNVAYADSTGTLFDTEKPEITVTYNKSANKNGNIYTNEDLIATVTIEDEFLIYSTDYDEKKPAKAVRAFDSQSENGEDYYRLTINGASIKEKDYVSKSLIFDKEKNKYVWTAMVTLKNDAGENKEAENYANKGPQILRVTARDKCGNTAQSYESKDLVIDTIVPRIVVDYTYRNGSENRSRSESNVDESRINIYSNDNVTAQITVSDAYLLDAIYKDKGNASYDNKNHSLCLNDVVQAMEYIEGGASIQDGKLCFDEEANLWIWKATFTMRVEKFNEMGANLLSMEAMDETWRQKEDKAPNKSIYQSSSIYLDNTAPELNVIYTYERKNQTDSTDAVLAVDEDGVTFENAVENRENNFIYSSGAIKAMVTIEDPGLDYAGKDSKESTWQVYDEENAGFDPKIKVVDENGETVQHLQNAVVTDASSWKNGEEQWNGVYIFDVTSFENQPLFGIEISAHDECGNELNVTKLSEENGEEVVPYYSGLMQIDTDPPEILTSSLTLKDQTKLEKFLHFLSFGTFFGKNATLTVEYEDIYNPKNEALEEGVVGSGVKTACIYFDGGRYVVSEEDKSDVETIISADDSKKTIENTVTAGLNHTVKHASYTFDLPYEIAEIFEKNSAEVSLTVTDYVGHECRQTNLFETKMLETETKQKHNGFIMYDDTAPTIKADYKKLTSYMDGEYYWMDNTLEKKELVISVSDDEFGMKADSDNNSGLNTVVISIENNGKILSQDMIRSEVSGKTGMCDYTKLKSITKNDVYTIPFDGLEEGVNTVTVDAMDNAGNDAKQYSFHICKDTRKPVVKNVLKGIHDTGSYYSDADGNSWYEDGQGNRWFNTKHVKYNIDVYDVDPSDVMNCSGLQEVSVSLNNRVVDTRYYYMDKDKNHSYHYSDKKTVSDNLSFYLDECIDLKHSSKHPVVEGKNTITVDVKDNSGNVVKTYQDIVYIDTKEPEIVGFTFHVPDMDNLTKKKTANLYQSSNSNIADIVKVTRYGYYFAKDVEVTVKAADASPSSGICEIVYKAIDKDGKVVTLEGVSKKSEKVDSGIKKQDAPTNFTTTETTFKVPASFRGQIFAYAQDNARNKPTTVDKEGGKSEKFASSDEVIVENKKKHDATSDVTIKLPETKTFTTDHQNLYNHNVEVNFDVADFYSGIRTVEWTLTSPDDEGGDQKGLMELDNDGKLIREKAGWKVKSTDQNIVTSMRKTITVTNNSNDIRLWVKMTDRSGYTKEMEEIFSIDKTDPVIEVKYNNNSPDPSNLLYYKEDRTATVTVTERNFDEEDIACRVTNALGSTPKLTKFAAHKVTNHANDKDQYIATITFHEDGDYDYTIDFTDLSGNKANQYKDEGFTIDETAPVIQCVSLNNSNVANGNYYNKTQSAIITIVEHNFDPARVVITGSATDDGKGIGYPGIGGWSSSGDTHCATIIYDADGYYTLDVGFTDMAGNIATSPATTSFYVDQTAPVVEITKVEDTAAYTGDIRPEITFTDTNYASIDISVTKVLRESTDTKTVVVSAGSHGGSTRLENPKYEKDNDGVYSLDVKVTDLAGNETVQKVDYCVNRYGSVFVYSKGLVNAIKKQYNQSIEEDLYVMAYNATNITKARWDIARDGTTILKEEEKPEQDRGGVKWHNYRFDVDKDSLNADGLYTLTLTNEDESKQIISTNSDDNNKPISFYVDHTAPILENMISDELDINAIDSEAVVVNAQKLNLNYKISDEIGLKEVTVYVNGKEQSRKDDLNRQEWTGALTVEDSSDHNNIVLIAKDLTQLNVLDTRERSWLEQANNRKYAFLSDIVVTTNPLILWYANQFLFWSSIAGAGAVGAVAGGLFLRRRKR